MTTPSLNLLIVEDESLIAMLIEDYCAELGHRVHGIASSVPAALDMVEAGGFDAAIVDLQLADDQNSEPVLDRLAHARIPFVLASGGMRSQLAERHRGVPALVKPFTLATLEQALDQLR